MYNYQLQTTALVIYVTLQFVHANFNHALDPVFCGVQRSRRPIMQCASYGSSTSLAIGDSRLQVLFGGAPCLLVYSFRRESQCAKIDCSFSWVRSVYHCSLCTCPSTWSKEDMHGNLVDWSNCQYRALCHPGKASFRDIL